MKIYNVLIVEDEIPAQTNLRRVIEKHFDDLRIVGVQSSVVGTVAWLRDPANRPDIIFMDVQLSDGMCFDIFTQTEVAGKVVITTAYDDYAIRAFRINSVDYLLKPIVPEDLQAAVERCRKALEKEHPAPAPDAELLRSLLAGGPGREYKKRFVVRLGDKITVVNTEQIAYFYAEDKYTYLVTTDGRRMILDTSLDAASEQVDPRRFFRLSRNCTVAIDAIAGISKHLSNRLKVSLEPRPDFEVFVSRSRTSDFMDWLEDKRE
ncbi:MAG: LytTR family DNA-binding domain-containing protein [Alistipes sp.]|nr:LytTR family DNA-binding domain-containing protein [Alistipes senegalensis]MCM1251165.1 LytTR family DNA-binding domain-containing protein [Alistipes sp.]